VDLDHESFGPPRTEVKVVLTICGPDLRGRQLISEDLENFRSRLQLGVVHQQVDVVHRTLDRRGIDGQAQRGALEEDRTNAREPKSL
jgi:hypothetical protein